MNKKISVVCYNSENETYSYDHHFEMHEKEKAEKMYDHLRNVFKNDKNIIVTIDVIKF